MGYKTDTKFVKNSTIQLLYNHCTKINIWLQYSALSCDIHSISHITVKRAKFKTISGEVNIPYGTKLEVGGNVLLYNGKPVCAVFSDCAYEFFAQNDDGQGLLRGKLIQTIKSTLAKHDEAHQDRWDKIWDDPRCQQYKCSDRDDFWLWNHDFYNAEIEDLKHIAKLIGAKEVK